MYLAGGDSVTITTIPRLTDPPLTANQITSGILVALSERYHPQCHVFRVNVLVARAGRGTVRSAPVGTADLIGCVRGLPVAIEIKAGRDRLSTEQKLFAEQWSKSGGLYVVAKNVEDCMREIEKEIRSREVY